MTARRLRVTGVVQGVGFRPFVHRLATRLALAGWVRNAAGDVEIALEGDAGALDAFVGHLRAGAPPLARIDRVEVAEAPPVGLTGFAIDASVPDPARRPTVAPDVVTCAECERELFDPADRRHRYPFLTCTDCGPRYTVIEEMPYDRERTTMRAFRQCPECLHEYRTPGDRRFHSETNGCPRCGPRLSFAAPDPLPGTPAAPPLDAAAEWLRRGMVVAVRGVGGFHLAALADDEGAVRRLRERKHRDAKPLAVMVRTLDEARAVAELTPAEEACLASRERPIVLARRRAGGPLAPAVAPGLDTVGLMLAYTPLHHLLLDRVRRPLVMTSGNRSDEPIAAGTEEALTRLAGIADAFLMHDREIVSPVDDSVVRVAGGAPLLLRRARGFAPLAVAVPVAAPVPLVAVGPHLKNTFTLLDGRQAFVSPHVGDLEGLEAVEHFRRTLARYRQLFGVEPAAVARDLHPGYLSTRLAEEMGLPTVVPVQHHHAHVAAVMAEHGVTAPVVGVAFDGTGYGDDGCVWGAELLVADLAGYRRVGQLRYAPLPGGDLAARQPWRAALGYAAVEPALAARIAAAFAGVDPLERRVAARQAERGVNAPLASSMGRLFDAAAAVLGVCRASRYEGEAAMRLEGLAGRTPAEPLPFPAGRVRYADGERWTLDPAPLLAALAERRRRGADAAALAAAFHESVAAAAAELAAVVAAEAGLDTVALGGGSFQNARLLESMSRRLAANGLRVLVPRALPPNDGGVSYGQAAVAAAVLAVRQR